MKTLWMLLVGMVGLLVGIVAGRMIQSQDLDACQRRVQAAELTQQGCAVLMDGCLEQQERLEVCELGELAADGIMNDYELDVTALRALVRALKNKCAPDGAETEGS